MKPTFAILTALAITAPAHSAEYGVHTQHVAIECTARDIGAAFRGDFSNWVLPDWVPGPHKRAGEISKCEEAGR